MKKYKTLDKGEKESEKRLEARLKKILKEIQETRDITRAKNPIIETPKIIEEADADEIVKNKDGYYRQYGDDKKATLCHRSFLYIHKDNHYEQGKMYMGG